MHRLQISTHDDVMLTQHRNLPQALIGESVKVIRSVLPPRPALGPPSLDKFICIEVSGSQIRGRQVGRRVDTHE